MKEYNEEAVAQGAVSEVDAMVADLASIIGARLVREQEAPLQRDVLALADYAREGGNIDESALDRVTRACDRRIEADVWLGVAARIVSAALARRILDSGSRLNTRQVAALAGVTDSYVRTLARNGTLIGERDGLMDTWWIDPRSIREWLETR
jgi:hypothetical protein